MTSKQCSRSRSSWKLAPATRSASTGGEVPVGPDQRKAPCERQRTQHHRMADHEGGGTSVRRADVCKGMHA